MAPLIAGFILAGLLAARVVPDLRAGLHPGIDDDPESMPDREVLRGRQSDPRPPADPGRVAVARLIAAAVAGPVLGLWGTVVGATVGWLIALDLMAIPTPIFFGKMLEMLWARDVVGLGVKGVAFGAVAGLVACFEGLRGLSDPREVPAASARAAAYSALAILALNGTWYYLMYMAGPAFGPTVLTPPPH
jgi:phospholipid/cholesterol/gamma-HCH transport system permease protein